MDLVKMIYANLVAKQYPRIDKLDKLSKAAKEAAQAFDDVWAMSPEAIGEALRNQEHVESKARSKQRPNKKSGPTLDPEGHKVP